MASVTLMVMWDIFLRILLALQIARETKPEDISRRAGIYEARRRFREMPKLARTQTPTQDLLDAGTHRPCARGRIRLRGVPMSTKQVVTTSLAFLMP